MSSKSKKWLVIAIISLVLFAAEVVAAILFVLPSMQKNEFFDYVKKGDVALAGDAQKTIDKLSDSDKKAAVDMVEDLIVKETNNYINGKKSYEELKRLLVTVENIKNCWGMTAGCFKEANKLELGKIYDELVAIGSNGSGYADKEQEFKDVFYITDYASEGEEQTMVNYLGYFEESVQLEYINGIKEYLEAKLKASYDSYVAGSLDANKLSDETDMLIKLVYEGYYTDGFAYTVRDELKISKEIREYRDAIKTKADSQDYVGALKTYLELYEKYGSNVVYLDYRTEIEELRQKAYDDGLTFYKNKFDELLKAKDKDGAQKLYDEIKDFYGEAFNIDEIIGSMKPEWADAYIYVIKNLDDVVKQCMDSETEMDKVMPLTSADFIAGDATDYLIADLDGNKTPELIIMGATMSHIFTYENGNIVYIASTGFLATTAENGVYVTALLLSNDTSASETYAEFTLSGKTITVLSSSYGYASSTGESVFKVNGADSDKEGFVNAGNEIIKKAGKDFASSGKISGDYETVISNYQE